MKQKNLRTVFKKQWGNSILSINLRFWSCDYCGLPLKDNKPFAVVQVNGSLKAADAKIFDKESCLRIFIIKHEAKRAE